MTRKLKRKPVPISEDLHYRLDMYAAATKQTIREVAERAIAAYLQQQQAGEQRTSRVIQREGARPGKYSRSQ